MKSKTVKSILAGAISCTIIFGVMGIVSVKNRELSIQQNDRVINETIFRNDELICNNSELNAVIEYVTNRGTLIRVTTNKGLLGSSNSDGLYISGQDKIIVDGTQSNPRIQECLAHEVGHAFDMKASCEPFVYDSVVNEYFDECFDEALNLFNYESMGMVNEDDGSALKCYINNREEYFAQTFAMYICGGEDRDILEQYAPNTYEHMRKLVQNICLQTK